MKSDRLYPVFVVLLVLLLVGSGTLAVVLYRMLNESGGGDRAGGDVALPTEGRGLLGGWRFGGSQGAASPGLDGTHDKWALHAPAVRPRAQPGARALAQDPRSGRFVADAGFYGMPVLFEEDCDDFGGEYSLLAPGADLNAFLSPGMLCLDVQRPEIEVPENQKRIYTVGEVERNACDLDRTIRLCFDIGKVSPQSASRSWDPLYGPSPVQSRDATNILELWHSPFGDAPAGETGEAEGDDASWAAPSPPNAPGSSRHYYFLNNNPQQWFTDLPPSATATLLDIQPGVDLSVYADQNRLEYVLVFWPETDPIDVEFSFQEALGVRELGSDNVAIDYDCATLIQHRPFAYAWYAGRPYEMPAYYSVAGKTVRMQFADRQAPPLTTSEATELAGNSPELHPPVTDYLSHLGGRGSEQGYAVAVDNNGYAYVAGATTSREFGTGNGAEAAPGAGRDAFVTKFRISDRQVIYTTLIGGRHDDLAYALAAAPDGSVYVAGETISPDFATVTAPPGGVIGRGWDAFVVKLEPDGRLGDFACRLGGRGDDRVYGIVLDADQNLYLAGVTYSDDFPTTDGVAPSGPGGGADAFLMKLRGSDGELLFSTRLGGSGDDQAYGLAIGPDQAPVLVGQTSSKDFPVVVAQQPDLAGGATDAFVTKFSSDGSKIAFSTFLGGTQEDRALAVAVDLADGVWLAGETASVDFPTVAPQQASFAGGNWDAFLCRLPPEGAPLLRSTYLGGSGDDRAFGLAVEASGRPHVAGTTSSTNLSLFHPIQDKFGGGDWDGFVAGFNDAGNALRYLTFIGGSSNDSIHALTIEAGRILHLGGTTESRDLNVVDPLQSAHRGADDALVGRLLAEYPRTPPLRLVPAGGMPGGPFYDYYMGKYEVTNEEFAHFLNDAQANPDNERGTNVYFDAYGNAWMNPEMVRERDELFSIHDSRLVYAAHYPVGSRYNVTPRVARDGGSYARHPVVGASWYGSVKYCNWLTIETGRGEAHRCYREGTKPLDWAPVTCSPAEWRDGQFSSLQRFDWLRYRGFRLPMDNSARAPEAELAFLVSHDEFADFLNDAQANPDTLRATNMLFDAYGNVRYAAATDGDEALLFSLANTWLTYDAEAPLGSRYQVVQTPPGTEPPPYTERVIPNVTWFGAMKYCNWLTLIDGIEPGERAYREGPTPLDWAPTTASKSGWARAEFTEAERRYWLQLKGCRLPFISQVVRENNPQIIPERLTATNSWPNAFNEVLKAAGWLAGTNATFGFGRDQYNFQDANYLDSGMFAKHDTTPVGFYDGSDHEGRSQTRTNENLFGIYDMSGNAAEWTSDFGLAGSSLDRAYHGGSWRFPLPAVTERAYVHPYFTENFMGFRIATVTSSEKMCVLRIPFRLCICGYGVGAGCGRGAGEEGDGIKAEDSTIDRRRPSDLDEDEDHRGVIIRDDDEGDEGGGGGDGGDEGGGGGPGEPGESPSDDGG